MNIKKQCERAQRGPPLPEPDEKLRATMPVVKNFGTASESDRERYMADRLTMPLMYCPEHSPHDKIRTIFAPRKAYTRMCPTCGVPWD